MIRVILLHGALSTAVSLSALAQGPPVDPYAAYYPPEPSYQQDQQYQYQQPPASPRLSQELCNLAAPIALNPDMLLSQVLAASTYPIEIMQAQQWMASNQGLRQQLVETECGAVHATHRAYQHGMNYLLSTQYRDGSWYVRSRSIKFQPYFQSGFPFDHDQWISGAGTSWAAMAIAKAVAQDRVERSAAVPKQ